MLANRTQVLHSAEGIAAFRDILGSAADHIRRVRFSDYCRRTSG